MTSGRRLAVPTVVGIAVVCLTLGFNAIMARSLRADGGDRQHLVISSIDLGSGTGDAILSARDIVPGDAVSGAVTVTNSGRQPITYAMSRGSVSAGGATLSAALVLTIKSIGSSCADFDGTILFEGPLGEAAFGSEGDGRALPAATAEILCFRVALPLDADNALQGAATTVALSFDSSWQAALR